MKSDYDLTVCLFVVGCKIVGCMMKKVIVLWVYVCILFAGCSVKVENEC